MCILCNCYFNHSSIYDLWFFSDFFLPFVSVAYIVEVESYCVANSCLKITEFKAQVDTGSSFTYLPHETYEQVLAEVLLFSLKI